ncbi:hypothetical protein [Streptococcus suis]
MSKADINRRVEVSAAIADSVYKFEEYYVNNVRSLLDKDKDSNIMFTDGIMNRIKKLIICIIGGIMMIGSSGCATEAEKVGNTSTTSNVNGVNRTAEEAGVESEFEPLFEFLAAEKKDFSKVERYKTTISVLGERKDTELTIDYLPNVTNKADYLIDTGNEELMLSIEVTDSELIYSEAVEQKFPISFFYPNIEKEFFKSLIIDSYISEHLETYMKDIRYGMGDATRLPFDLKETYDQLGYSGANVTSINVHSTATKEFSISIVAEKDSTIIQLVLFLQIN